MSTKFEARPQRKLAEEMIAKSIQAGTFNSDTIAKDTGYTPQHINRLARRIKTQVTPIPPEAPPEKEGEEKPIEQIVVTPPAKLRELKEEPKKPTPEEVEGFIKSKQITQLFQSVNLMIPAKYRRPQESMELLGDMWYKPLNRILEKYANKNYDIIIASITTVIIFAPVPVEMMQDRAEKPKQPQENKTP